jgi:hypothetical protein
MLDEAFPRSDPVQWREHTIRFGRPTLKTQSAFKEELEREALAGLRRKRDMMDVNEYADAIRALSRDFTARVYAWGKPEWARCLVDLEWTKRLLWHVLVQEVLPEKQSLNPWLTPELMDRLFEDTSYPAVNGKPAGNLLDEAYGKLMGPDPNPSAPPGTAERAA